MNNNNKKTHTHTRNLLLLSVTVVLLLFSIMLDQTLICCFFFIQDIVTYYATGETNTLEYFQLLSTGEILVKKSLLGVPNDVYRVGQTFGCFLHINEIRV